MRRLYICVYSRASKDGARWQDGALYLVAILFDGCKNFGNSGCVGCVESSCFRCHCFAQTADEKNGVSC